ncbi:MAG: Mrp/NBP35 family ATP-binding protein [Alistipes sp.]|nr:Mrp/NBP35 family ATP-binding protein [Alistipes sp.]
MNQTIATLLAEIIHPETGQNIIESEIVESIAAEGNNIEVSLLFHKARDPFALKIKGRIEALLREHYPTHTITVTIREAERRRNEQQAKIDEMKANSTTRNIGRVIAIASGKGGVGKSTITSNLAVALQNEGYRVGILDADVYGPSQAKMFGVEDYLPEARRVDGMDYIIPADAGGIKLISIAMFYRPTDALLWRGTFANSALRQLIHQTEWGELDFLLIDLPPGTGDIHLSIINELKIDGAIIVSTPQQVALADVVRGVEMFRHPNIAIDVLGIIENMAWFTPAELPTSRYYIFGRGGAARYAAETGVDLLGEVPIVQSIMEGGDSGLPATKSDSSVEQIYRQIAQRIVEKCGQ